MPDLVVVGIGMRFKQLPRHQHETRRAEAALRGAGFEEGLLDRRELAVLGEAFDGRDLLAVGERREIEAAGHRGAVDQHRAAAAQALRAALARAEQIEAVAQHSTMVWCGDCADTARR